MILQFRSLPGNWILTKIEDICTDPQYGYTTKASNNGNLKLLRTTDITSGKINWDQVPFCAKNPDDINKYLLQDGDIVISRAGSVGVSYLIKKPVKAIFASYLIRFNPLTNKRYFKYYLGSPYYWNSISRKKLGIAIPNVNATKLKSINFPLAPLNEQNRIVEKIEELFSELDNAFEELKKTQEQLKIYQQAVLKAAFEGKFINGSILSKIIKLGDATFLITKGSSPKWQGINYVNDDTQVLFITSENVRSNYIDISKPKYLEEKFNIKQKRSILKKGDVLLNIVGASIGRAAIFNSEKSANINQAVSLIRCNKNIYNKYLAYFLNSLMALNYYNSCKVDVARANLSLKDVTNILFPYYKYEIQEQIVNEIESRLSVCDKLEETVQQSLEKIEYLRQSILKKAFEGKLVQQNPNDEPAEKLLERIKQEKEKFEFNNKKRNTR